MKDIILNAILHIYIYVNGIRKQNADSTYNLQIPPTFCGFHLQFADSACNLRILLLVAESATAQFIYTNFLLFIWGFHKLFWILPLRLRIPQNRLFLEQFWAVQWFRYLFVKSKTANKIKNADSATNLNLILACCGIHLQCTECTVWPRNPFFLQMLDEIFSSVSLP